ncbi:hypothetical protein [Galbibacter pacificus]|uniref:Major tail protein n=1 Tax=Galbibacter pacificus TaxID=2996052 RepID=A0ABT6FR54_9FLAO|nr:hypothetical protein [Galbibacter pacificus]MDG3581772.1 hypothetical protein [Galbibacter pacificus]MDG3585754.1 hypothetical protein [Galbibacter pacificus]
MSCLNKLTSNITYDCTTGTRAKGGLEGKAVIINKADIDLQALTQSGSTVTNLSLNAGESGYDISWVKQLGSASSTFAVNDGLDSFTHAFLCRVFGSSAEDAERIKELSEGEFVVVVETKYKGEDNADAFKVYGLENGLKMSEATMNSTENDNSMLFTLSSLEGFGEQYPYLVFLETDYSTSKAKFDDKFSS